MAPGKRAAMKAKAGQTQEDLTAPLPAHKNTAGILMDITSMLKEIMDSPALEALPRAQPPKVGAHKFAAQA